MWLQIGRMMWKIQIRIVTLIQLWHIYIYYVKSIQSLDSKSRSIHTQDEYAPIQQLVSVDVDDPLQGAPPQLGVGLVQERVSVRVAYPHEEDQEVETAHDDQPPLAAEWWRQR